MFGNKKTTSIETMSTTSNSSAINTLVEGTHVDGTINSTNDIRIDGRITGTINCEGKLIIGPSGKVEGIVVCQNAVIEGYFSGDLQVKEVLDVRESATILGEIKTSKLLVQNGATFNGNCDMGSKLKNLSTTPAEASAS